MAVLADHRQDQLVPLPGTSWEIWRDVLLRTTGFPVDGLDRFAMPSAAEAADALLAGELDQPAFDRAFADAAAASSRTAYEIAGYPLFREAVTWQNPGAVNVLDGLRRTGPHPDPSLMNKRARRQRRRREELVARYWQRYCGKCDTIGFFGPDGWITIRDDTPAIVVEPGPGLVRERRVWFEQWALAALAERLAGDEQIRVWLPVILQAPLRLVGSEVLRPVGRPVQLTPTEAAVLARCDGHHSAARLCAELVADPDVALHKQSDGYLLLNRLAERGLVRWGVDLPLNPDAEQVLADTLQCIEDVAARDRALAAFDRLRGARDAVAVAAGDPDRLAAALTNLDDEFAAVTGETTRRGAGQTYAGRSLCYEDTIRDLDMVLGRPVLEVLAGPMRLLLQSARWLSKAIAEAYATVLRDLHREQSDELGSPDVPAAPLWWYLAQGTLTGTGPRPADTAIAEFVRRWSAVFGLDRLAPDVTALELTSGQLATAVDEHFPAERPGWSGARLHSPDLTLCAPSVDAINRGDFTAVLGELHATWCTANCSSVLMHEDPGRLRAALRRDLGPERLLLLFQPGFRRLTGRLARCLDDDSDVLLGYTSAPGTTGHRLLPITALTVSPVDGELMASAPDGRTWPVIELFGELAAIHASEAFKQVATASHTPRITVDRLVVSRRTWRITVADSGLADAREYQEQFLAGRRLRAALGLPERVFVKIATELKPVYVDFTAPRYVSSLCAMVRASRAEGGDGVVLTLTEMLPTPDQAWVPDAEGRRYLSELRLQIRDPEPAR